MIVHHIFVASDYDGIIRAEHVTTGAVYSGPNIGEVIYSIQENVGDDFEIQSQDGSVIASVGGAIDA